MREGLEKLRLLFWLKWRLMLRMYQRQMSAAVGAILGIVIFVPLALAVGGGCLAGFLLLEPWGAEHLLRGVLLGAYLLWLLSPLFGYALTEDYDISKLFVFPLSPRLILAGTILGSVIDLGVLILLPTVLAVVIGFTKSVWAFPVVVGSLGLFLFHALALSQAINLSSAGVLRSRRARDIMVVAIPLLLTVFYVGMQALPHRLVRVNWSRVLEGRTWEIINYLPSGLAARAIGGAARGEYVPALGLLLALAAVSVGTLYLAGWLVERLYGGEVVSAPARRRAARPAGAALPEGAEAARPASRGRLAGWLEERLGPAAQAVMDKEVKYFARDPYFKHILVMMVYMLAVLIVVFLRPWHGEGLSLNVGDVTLWAGTGLVLMMESALVFNMFGTEGPAASVLFMFPSSRREIVIGKNLAGFAALSAANVAAAVLLSALARKLYLAPLLLLWMELGTAMLISCGNFVSVLFPARVVVRGWGIRQQSASRGVTQGLVSLAALGVASGLMLPALAAVVVPTYWISLLWLTITIPVAVGYAGFLYRISLRLTEAALLKREIEVAEALRQQD